MAKKIDLTRTVYELTQEYPELIQIMEKLGFTEITKKPMLMSAGKIMAQSHFLCDAGFRS